MNMKTVQAVVAVVGATVAAGVLVAGGSASSGVVGHLYVNDNSAGVNSVAGYDRHADGSLTPIPGSPFAVGGAGTGHPDASQGSLELSSDGRYLLAVDAGSNQISVSRIKPDGSLQNVQGSPYASNGVNPVSIAVSGKLVYVANQGPGQSSGDTNYTGFTINAGGHLTSLPGSTVTLPADSKPGDVVFNADGSRLIGTRIATSAIDSFTVAPDGLLTATAGSPFDAQSFTPPQGYGQLGSEFSPVNPNLLIVSDAHNAAGGGAPGLVSSFSVGATVTPIGGSPVPNDGVASCWVEISHDGAFVFVVNTGSSTISTYQIGGDGSLSFLQSTGAGQLGAGAEDARLSPDGSTLWVVAAGSDAVFGFAVDGPTLTPLSTTPGPAGIAPTGIVLT